MNPAPFEQYGLGIPRCHMKKYLKGITQDDYGSKSPAAATSLSNQQRLSSEIITRAWL